MKRARGGDAAGGRHLIVHGRERLDLAPREVVRSRGHAIECRVYAEDPDAGFLPSPGRVLGLRAPDGPGVRDDSIVEAGAEISIYYDPLVSKLIVWGRTRDEAIARILTAIETKLRQSEDLQVGLRMTSIKTRLDVMGLLTPEQRAKEQSEPFAQSGEERQHERPGRSR